MYYRTCPNCGANLDPEERCDCLDHIYRCPPRYCGTCLPADCKHNKVYKGGTETMYKDSAVARKNPL
jgi:hypothetical protein